MDALLEQIKAAGVVGCGGAGFPTHIKWNVRDIEYFIVNAAECEPLLDTDKFLIRHYADRIISACEIVGKHLNAKNVIVAVKENYDREIEALEKAIKDAASAVRIHKMRSFYPAGDEHVIVHEVTGRTAPYGGLPIDAGAVVSNADTMYEAYFAAENRPFVRKHLTVAGEVESPCVIEVPIGTSIADCLRLAGGVTAEECFVVSGGPMMGKAIPYDEIEKRYVTKTTSGILALKKDSYIEKYKEEADLQTIRKKAAAACIQCSFCTMMCPRHLLGHPLEPHRIMRGLAYHTDLGDFIKNSAVAKMASLCSLCGVCATYACPMGLEPSKVNQLLKDKLAENGIRGEKGEARMTEESREFRKIPTGRLAGRLGIGKYMKKVKDVCIAYTPEKVSISLKQGAGAPAEPIVDIGDTVEKGELIAKIPEGKIGSNIHASISGKITSLSDMITITGGK